jgi:excisionase family DNA binding protein
MKHKPRVRRPRCNGDDVNSQPQQHLGVTSGLRSMRGLVMADVIAEVLDSTSKHVYAMAKAGRIPHIRIGTMVRFDPIQIADWITAHSIAA